MEFLHVLEVHDESTALPVLAGIPTMIACGDDVLTPVIHSEEMAAVLPDSGGGPRRRAPGAATQAPQVINDALVSAGRAGDTVNHVALTRRWKARTRHA